MLETPIFKLRDVLKAKAELLSPEFSPPPLSYEWGSRAFVQEESLAYDLPSIVRPMRLWLTTLDSCELYYNNY